MKAKKPGALSPGFLRFGSCLQGRTPLCVLSDRRGVLRRLFLFAAQEIFVLRRDAAAYVSLRQIFSEHGANGAIEICVYRLKPLGNILVYRRFAGAEFERAASDRVSRFDDVCRFFFHPFNDIIPHR